MYTLDEYIERLQQLREIAKEGGQTPVTVYDGEQCCNEAAVELQNVLAPMSYHSDRKLMWAIPDGTSPGTHEVIKVF